MASARTAAHAGGTTGSRGTKKWWCGWHGATVEKGKTRAWPKHLPVRHPPIPDTTLGLCHGCRYQVIKDGTNAAELEKWSKAQAALAAAAAAAAADDDMPDAVDDSAASSATASLSTTTTTTTSTSSSSTLTTTTTVYHTANASITLLTVQDHDFTEDVTTCLFISQPDVPAQLYSAQPSSHVGLVYRRIKQCDGPISPTYHGQQAPRYHLVRTLQRTDVYYMPLVPFDLPPRASIVAGNVAKLYNANQTAADVAEDVLELVRAANCDIDAEVLYVQYAKDDEKFNAWQTAEWEKMRVLSDKQQSAVKSPLNPWRFQFDPLNLCSLLLGTTHTFRGFMTPSWYSKTPGSFFCLHVEQLFAPFYNYCYEGSTTWWVVHPNSRPKLDEYIVKRAREWYKVPESEVLSLDEQKAVAGLLYTKCVLFHPKDMVDYGINVTMLKQVSGEALVGLGDAVHFGMATEPPEQLRGEDVSKKVIKGRSKEAKEQRDAAAASVVRSRNEAVNFVPVQWLTTGLPALLRWMRWLQMAWLPVQTDELKGSGKQRLRAAMVDEHTNRRVAQHCTAVWSRPFLEAIKVLFNTPAGKLSAPHLVTMQAIDAWLKKDDKKRSDVLSDIVAVLKVMKNKEVAKWLEKHG